MTAPQRPLVSVVVPVYKVEPYLRRCLDSILTQTYDRLEVIVVDDGSPDDCPGIVDEYAARDSRVVAVHQENRGLGPARNAGIGLATGEFVAFVDSDDHVHPRYVATLVARALATDADVAVCGFEFRYPSGLRVPTSPLSLRRVLTGEQAATKSLDVFAVPNLAWNKLYRRELLVDHGIAFPPVYYEDTAVMPGIMRRARRVAITHRPLYRYCLRGSSITGRFGERNIQDFLRVGQMVAEDMRTWEDPARWERHYRRFTSHAWMYLAISIAHHPRLTLEGRLATLRRTNAQLAALRAPAPAGTPPTVSDVVAAGCDLLSRVLRRVRGHEAAVPEAIPDAAPVSA